MNTGINCRICAQPFALKVWQITSRDYRCLPCKRTQQNALNRGRDNAPRVQASYQRRKEYWKQYRLDRKSDPSFILKRRARKKVQTEIEAGRLIRGSCEHCGKPNADAHHRDYRQPLLVQWLCRSCHLINDKAAEREKGTK